MSALDMSPLLVIPPCGQNRLCICDPNEKKSELEGQNTCKKGFGRTVASRNMLQKGK